MIDRWPESDVLRLESAALVVDIVPRRGADIVGVTDRATQINVLFRTPWDTRLAEDISPGHSERQWLAGYPGGWQILVPNAGPSRVHAGVELGYHGEASIAAWTVDTRDRASATLSVELRSMPITIRRRVRLAGPHLLVTDEIVNLSSTALPVAWVNHPAFGAPFVDRRCRIDTGARTILTDAASPGILAPAVISSWPLSRTANGDVIDMRVVPEPGSNVAAFAALADFADPAWFAITSPSAGFGIGVAWQTTSHEYAWWWQECNATAAEPWLQRAYVIAIEPANVLPGNGLTGLGMWRSRPPLLEPSARWEATTSLVRFTDVRPVASVDLDGHVSHEPVVAGGGDA